MIRARFLILLGAVVMSQLAIAQTVSESESQPDSVPATNHGILLADESVMPMVTIRWMSSEGEQMLSGQLPYGAPKGGEILEGADTGSNIRAYLALGGSRVDTGAGHPKGAVIRVGLTKLENSRPFFEDILPGTSIWIDVDGVVMSDPIMYHDGTGMMHLKYSIGDLEACALPGTANNQYLLSDPTDTLGGRVEAGVNATPGGLSGSEGESSQSVGSFDVMVDVQDPERVSYRVRVPFGLLRHLQDPWESVLPNTFFEPIHLHAEAEVLPVWAEPFDRTWELESNDPDQTLDDDSAKNSAG